MLTAADIERARRYRESRQTTAAPTGGGGAWYDPVLTVLDYMNRPYSGVMGGLQAINSGDPVLDSIMKGVRGEEDYGVSDLMEAAGMDPESRLVRWGGLAGDIVNPLDPLNWVGLGLTKAGKAAKITKNADILYDTAQG